MKTNTNYRGQEYWVLQCMYQDFKDLLKIHMRIILTGRETPEISLLERRITALEETMTPEDVCLVMRQMFLPKEKQLSNEEKTQLFTLKTKYPFMFADVKIQNIRTFFIEVLNHKPFPEKKVIERQLSMQDHFDLEQMMRLKEDEVN